MDVRYPHNRSKNPILPIIYVIFFQFTAAGLFGAPILSPAFAQEQEQKEEPGSQEVQTADSVELNGDTVEYSVDGNMVTVDGNVVVINKKMKLTCDHVEFSRDTNMAYAVGNIRLISTSGEVSEMTGDKLTFNFATMSGTFDGSKIYAKPYYGYGEVVSKVGENHIQMERNYITTCDLDKPHYMMKSKKMDMYPGDKLIAHGVRMLVGNVPLLYLPKFTQDLRNKKPKVIFTPGYDKDWGAFLLSKWMYGISDNFKGAVHVDAREKKGIAWGIDADYKTKKMGSGSIRTYYMNELNTSFKDLFQEESTPAITKERFKVQWRHKWDIDAQTHAISQYYKLSDSTILKDYFKREYDEDSSPDTFFLVTRTIPSGVLSFRTDARVNRFESAVERLPEVSYSLSNRALWDTGLYLKNATTYSNLTKKEASPSEARQNTMRVDTDSQLSYPMKISFLELTPFVGGRNTYYSKTNDPEKYGSVRGAFETGASLSTRFYKVYDTNVDKYGLEINRLRHIVLPSVNYEFVSEPTLAASQLDFFDSVDSLDNAHGLTFSIENRLQTKRNDQTVELLRTLISTPFKLKEDPAKGGFSTISTDIDFRPVDWVTFYYDSQYDTRKEYLTTANFDMYLNGSDKWSAGIGKRWNREIDDQLTTEFNYKLTPKWRLRTYARFDLDGGILKEQEFTATRDLHAWTMDLSFNETRGEGSEIWVIFTLKAFPDMAIDFGTSFNQRKAGSQSSGGN